MTKINFLEPQRNRTGTANFVNLIMTSTERRPRLENLGYYRNTSEYIGFYRNIADIFISKYQFSFIKYRTKEFHSICYQHSYIFSQLVCQLLWFYGTATQCHDRSKVGVSQSRVNFDNKIMVWMQKLTTCWWDKTAISCYMHASSYRMVKKAYYCPISEGLLCKTIHMLPSKSS